ncbi:hypothetical protein [Kitasatospora sp. NPDC093806]|uniref:hypothetical protein n=1 Tax=Kitasatospora sp. NPDC093806 TaxID=3155075 RepID=UPI003413FC78
MSEAETRAPEAAEPTGAQHPERPCAPTTEAARHGPRRFRARRGRGRAPSVAAL